MICPECKNLLLMTQNKVKVMGDQSALENTRVVLVPQFVCVNPECEGHKRRIVIEGEGALLYDGASVGDATPLEIKPAPPKQ